MLVFWRTDATPWHALPTRTRTFYCQSCGRYLTVDRSEADPPTCPNADCTGRRKGTRPVRVPDDGAL
jgi:hypothetical protein